MSKKVLPIVLIVFFGGILWAFRSLGKGDDNDTLLKQQQLVVGIGAILEQRHYDPKIINDSFSKVIFTKYLDDLDNYLDQGKDIFLASDIDSLKVFQNSIDDEIHGAPFRFFPTASSVFERRLSDAAGIYKEILSKPFDFSVKEDVQLNGDKLGYPATEADLKELWRKRLKYLTLQRFVDLQNQRSKSTVDSIKNQSDEKLEAEARSKVMQTMTRNFERLAKTFTEKEQFDLFINEITQEMDPHTEYFPPVEKRAFDEDMSGTFFGIGAQLKEEDGDIKIASLIPGSPAWKSGKIQLNDAIVKVAQGNAEPVDITGYAITDAVKLIRGDKGTEVRLTLKKTDGTIQVVPIIRGEIVQDESYARSAIIQDGAKKIGYIYLPEFYADFDKADGHRCSSDIATEVQKLKAEKVDGIILDLRFNGGGYLQECVQMAGLFIKSGPVVQVRNREGQSQVLDDDDTTTLYKGPMAVMVNELSASASEIFAAAMQDYKRAIIVGSSSTYGKGTVQKTLPLGKPVDMFSGATEFGALKLTFQKFYRISGGSTQLKGVTPDVILPDTYEYLKIREKDNPSALSWDQIPPTEYSPWKSTIDWKAVEDKAEQRIHATTAFSQIEKNTEWLQKNMNDKVDLDIPEYKEQQKMFHNIAQEDDSLAKLPYKMNVNCLTVDRDKFYNNPDKQKGERYQQWLKSLSTDLYLNQTVKILGDMATGYKTGTATR